MFGIDDPGIYLAYAAAIACLAFAVVFGIRQWNRDYDEPSDKRKP